jgi:hypothetical protein
VKYALPVVYTLHHVHDQENQQTERSHGIVHQKKNHLQLIALPQPFLHSLLHKSSSRPRHLKLALSNFYITKTQYPRTVNRTASFVVIIVVVGVDVAEQALGGSRAELSRQLPVESNLGSQAGDLIAVLGVYVCKDGVCALSSSTLAPMLTHLHCIL